MISAGPLARPRDAGHTGMSRIQRTVIRSGMQFALWLAASIARRPALAGVTDRVMRKLAISTVRRRRIRTADDLVALGLAWQKGFPSARQVPIASITADTVYAEILTPCPLRGSGDMDACHRMMAYDREVVAAAGGAFIVLQSQAEPGVTRCRVAMRFQGSDLADLIPAHLRAPAARPQSLR